MLDIETAPNVAYVWGLFKENIPLARLIDSGYVLSYAAKFLGDKDIVFDSLHKSGKKKFLRNAHALLEEADVVIHYNGKRFDIPTMNKEFVLEGMLPPATYKQIDLLQVARRQFRFPSNKLDYVAKALGVGEKVKHAGFDLWIRCMNNEEAAWKEMEEYNVHDVVILEKVYMKLLPWIPNHPNYGLYDNVADVCPNCGGVHLERRGFAYTNAGQYQRFQCKTCGTWSRSKQTVAVKGLLAHAA